MPSFSRPALRVEFVVLIVTAYLVVAMNGPWWTAVADGRSWSNPYNWLFIAAVFLVLVLLHFILFAVIANRWTVKPLLAFIVVGSAAAAYFMNAYSVLMDPTMIQNILNTDWKETRDLLTLQLIGAVLAWSAPALIFLWFVKIDTKPWLRSTLIRLAYMAGAFVVAVLLTLLIARDLTSMLRSHREMRYLITPGNLINGFAAQLKRNAKLPSGPRIPVGTDAHRIGPPASPDRPRVFVLVVGETARAANFSLFGYARATNPELARLDIVAFSHVTSCGTSTEVSLPCMFAAIGREDYDEDRIRGSEGLLDVLVRAGYAVKWIDNQSGCKDVCRGAGIDYQKTNPATNAELCADGECKDGILVQRLQEELPKVARDTVFVLHMMGNHGPAYFKRYPAAFRRFTPDCATAQLRDCSRDEVVITYDNAILYTDHVLAGLIGALRDRTTPGDSAMLYVSDHGESLGEKGLYLHGIPYAIAPEFQTHVPMIVWTSGSMQGSARLDVACLRAKAGDPLSHDNLFHSVLGLLDVATSAYQADHDFFSSCRAPAPVR